MREQTIIFLALALSLAISGCTTGLSGPGRHRPGCEDECEMALRVLDRRMGGLVQPRIAVLTATRVAPGRPVGIELTSSPDGADPAGAWAVTILGEDRVLVVLVGARAGRVLDRVKRDPGDYEEAARAEVLLSRARLGLADALAALEGRRILSVELEEEAGRPVFEARALESGRLRELLVDANTREIAPDGGGD